MRLSGCMSRDFASTLLHPDLQSISLNNLLTWSDMSCPPPASMTHIKDLQAHLLATGEQQLRFSAPDLFRLMHGVLNPLIGRCDNLTRLSISTMGNGDDGLPEFRDERYTQMYVS